MRGNPVEQQSPIIHRGSRIHGASHSIHPPDVSVFAQDLLSMMVQPSFPPFSSSPSSPHHRHQSSLETVIDFTTEPPLSPHARQRASRKFYRIVDKWFTAHFVVWKPLVTPCYRCGVYFECRSVITPCYRCGVFFECGSVVTPCYRCGVL